jgi:hypothetical protein
MLHAAPTCFGYSHTRNREENHHDEATKPFVKCHSNNSRRSSLSSISPTNPYKQEHQSEEEILSETDLSTISRSSMSSSIDNSRSNVSSNAPNNNHKGSSVSVTDSTCNSGYHEHNDHDDEGNPSDGEGSTGTAPYAQDREELVAKVTDLREELQRQDRQMEDLELDLKDALMSRQVALDEVDHLQELLNEISGENDELVNDMQCLMEDNDELKQQAGDSRTQSDEWASKVKDAKKEIAELQESLDAECEANGNSVQDVADELKHAKQTHERKLRKSNEERHQLERMVEELSEELEIMRDNMHGVLGEKKVALKRCKVLMGIMKSCSGQAGTCAQLLSQLEAESGELEGLSSRGGRNIVGGLRNSLRRGSASNRQNYYNDTGSQRASLGHVDMRDGTGSSACCNNNTNRSVSVPGMNMFGGGRKSVNTGTTAMIAEGGGEGDGETNSSDREEPDISNRTGMTRSEKRASKAAQSLAKKIASRRNINNEKSSSSRTLGQVVDQEASKEEAQAQDQKSSAVCSGSGSEPKSMVSAIPSSVASCRSGLGMMRAIGLLRGGQAQAQTAHGPGEDDDSGVTAPLQTQTSPNTQAAAGAEEQRQAIMDAPTNNTAGGAATTLRTSLSRNSLRQQHSQRSGSDTISAAAGVWAKELIPHNIKRSRWGSKVFMGGEERRAISLAAQGRSSRALGQELVFPGEIIFEARPASKRDCMVASSPSPSSCQIAARGA